jgi:hypothetical protein
MKKPTKISRLLFYIITFAHLPWTIVRCLAAVIVLVDGWCDKTIYKLLNEIEDETN